MEKQHDSLMAANPTLTFAAAFKLFCEQNVECNPFTAGCHAFLIYDQTEVCLNVLVYYHYAQYIYTT